MHIASHLLFAGDDWADATLPACVDDGCESNFVASNLYILKYKGGRWLSHFFFLISPVFLHHPGAFAQTGGTVMHVWFAVLLNDGEKAAIIIMWKPFLFTVLYRL